MWSARAFLTGIVILALSGTAFQAHANQRCSMVIYKGPPYTVPPFCACGGDCLLWPITATVSIGCEDGQLNPPDCAAMPAEFWDWYYGVTHGCYPSTSTFNNCEEEPTPDQCRDPRNNSETAVGDPVDLTTGALEQTLSDLSVGRGLVFERHYASNDPADVAGEMGKGWRHGLGWSLTYKKPLESTSVGEAAQVSRPLSAPVVFFRHTFPPPAEQDPPWVGGVNGSGSLSGDPAIQLVYVDDDGTRIAFDRVGSGTPEIFRLAEIRHPGEPAISVIHSGNTRTYTSGGATLTVTLNAGKVASVAGAGQQWDYSHDGAGCLRTVTGPNPGSPSGTVVWTYSYPTNQQTGNCATSQLTKIERQINGGATEVIAEWSFSGLRVGSVDEPALDQKLYLTYPTTSPNLTCAIRDVPGTTATPLATFTSNSGLVLNTTGEGGPGLEVPFAAASYVTTSGGVNTNRWKTKTDRRGFKTLYEGHDERGRPAAITEGWDDADQDGVLDAGESYERRREFEYHPSLDRETTIRERSAITGAEGDLVTRYDFDDPGAVGDTPVPNEAPTPLLHRRIVNGFTLDASGDPVELADYTTYGYDASGRLATIAGPRASNYTEIEYDPTSGSRSKLRRFVQGLTYLEWTFSNFDSRGNPQSVTDPNGRATQFTYDNLNRVRTVTPPYDGPASSTTTFTYDIDGNLTRVDLPNDSFGTPVFLRMGYDAKRNLLFLADSQGNAIVYEYQKGRATREARYTGFTDYSNRGTLVGDAEYSYTTAGRLFRAFNPLFGDDSVYAAFDHDPKGNPTNVTDENGREDVLLYDALDRLEEIQQLRTATYATDFEYDPRSNVIKVTDAADKVTDLLHDDRGNLVKIVSPDTGTTLFLHDAAGNLTQKIEALGTPASRTTLYGYDGLDRLTSIDLPNDADWTFTYDTSSTLNQKGRLASATNGQVTTELVYTARGDLATET